jgi:hypothetical protein
MKQKMKSYPPVRHLFILDRFQQRQEVSGEVKLRAVGDLARSLLIVVFTLASVALFCYILPVSDRPGMRYYIVAAIGSGTVAIMLTVSLLNQRHGGGSP